MTNKQIEDCKTILTKYKMREEVAQKLGTKVYLKPLEIAEIKKASRVVGSSVHPDTN